MNLPPEMVTIIAVFAPIFSERVWQQAQLLITGAILATGKRTVTSALRVVGHSKDKHFTNYHRVLNRASWSSLAASRLLLMMLIKVFAGDGPLIFGIDDTIERRRGGKIKAKGIYRDPVRSSHNHFVKASGLRWLAMMLMVRIPWAERIWALPFFTALAPSERYYQGKGRQHKKLTDWARQMILTVRRWLPNREMVVVSDSSFAALELLDAVREQVCMITRLRLDAALYNPAPKRKPKQNGRPRLKGKRLPTLEKLISRKSTRWERVIMAGWYGEPQREVEIATDTCVWYHTGMPVVPIRWVLIRDPKGEFDPQALLCTKLNVEPMQILQWFVTRWQMEVTFEESRAHLGIETQRQWSDKAIARTTPALFALFSIVTLVAEPLLKVENISLRQAAWYLKEQPTFSDTIALVRRHLWANLTFSTSVRHDEMLKIPRSLFECLIDTLCYAA
jgi:hypothetical protein